MCLCFLSFNALAVRQLHNRTAHCLSILQSSIQYLLHETTLNNVYLLFSNPSLPSWQPARYRRFTYIVCSHLMIGTESNLVFLIYWLHKIWQDIWRLTTWKKPSSRCLQLLPFDTLGTFPRGAVCVWYDMISSPIWSDLIWYDPIWFAMIWSDMIRSYVILRDLNWYDHIRNDRMWYNRLWSDTTRSRMI